MGMIQDADHGIKFKRKILITLHMEIFTHLLQDLLELLIVYHSRMLILEITMGLYVLIYFPLHLIIHF
jgi:hypothetical protein